MQLESLVNQNYTQLNENDKIAIKQIILQQKTFSQYSCEEIAQECHISRATLLRLCRKIGLRSFSDLKYLLKETEGTTDATEHDFHQVCSNYQFLLQDLRKLSFSSIVKKIDQANTIYIYGTGNEQKSIAQEMKRMLLSVGKCVIDLFDAGEIAFMKQAFQKDDVFIIVSLSGETKEGIKIIREIREQLHSVSLTRLDNNTIATLCEDTLYVSTQTLNTLQETSYEVVGAFYVLLDLLFMSYLEYRGRRV